MFRKVKRKLLTIFGDIKVFRWPFWIVYDPDMYGMTGSKIREVLDIVKPGDVVLRGYRHYADGYFIPGKYSHSGIYVGENQIVHAVAEGVGKIDILDFLMCDVCCVMRPVNEQMGKRAIERAIGYIGTKYDFNFSNGDSALYCHELTAMCFKEAKVERYIPKILGGLIRGREKVYLAQSFLESSAFSKVY